VRIGGQASGGILDTPGDDQHEFAVVDRARELVTGPDSQPYERF
jgi:hypothetical protein